MADGIGTLFPDLQDDSSGLNEYLRPSGTSTRIYVPIRKRPTCDPLELKQEKIRAKMAKLNENNSNVNNSNNRKSNYENNINDNDSGGSGL